MPIDCSLYNRHLGSKNKIIKFTNCRIVKDGNFVQRNIWVRNGKFIDMQKVFYDEKRRWDMEIDCKNRILAPGLIDVQINGGLGVDFCDQSQGAEHTKVLGKFLLTTGVTSYCPTLVTSSKETYRKVLPNIVVRDSDTEGAAVLGCHLEGPFINPQRKGAHEAKNIRKFEFGGYEDVLEVYGNLDNTRIITLAPELENALSAIWWQLFCLARRL
ncbi:hypothetical protein ACOME3_005887 [Neoechinorhynchus agilis]